MDKVVLTRDDITALLDWRDAHKDLVRSFPAPLRAVEINFPHNNYRIKGIRDGNWLELYLSEGYNSLGHVKMELIYLDGMQQLALRKGKLKCNQEGFQSILTVYCSLMALMVYGQRENAQPEEAPPVKERKPCKPSKPSAKKSGKRITYILRRDGSGLQLARRGSHRSPSGTFSVRGHYRHYKSGKVVWVAEYEKGAGRKKSKTYKMGGKTNGNNG